MPEEIKLLHKSDLETGDILLQPMTGICGRVVYLFTGIPYVNVGVFDAYTRKVHSVIPYWGKVRTDLSKWRWSIVLRNQFLTAEEKIRMADETVNFVERLHARKASEYSLWSTLKSLFCSNSVTLNPHQQTIDYVVNLFKGNSILLSTRTGGKLSMLDLFENHSLRRIGISVH